MTRILIINNAEQGILEFALSVEKIIMEAGAESRIIGYADCLTTNLEEFDGIILTGSPQGDDIVEHHAPYFYWIKNYQNPVFGICAGHHITGFLYGAGLLRSEEPESGDVKISILENDPLLDNLKSNFKARQMHNDSITLPTDFKLLASSTTCRNQLMKHKQKPLYTCQFHPEYNNPELFRNFIKICSGKVQQ